jgi:hypothetical protein
VYVNEVPVVDVGISTVFTLCPFTVIGAFVGKIPPVPLTVAEIPRDDLSRQVILDVPALVMVDVSDASSHKLRPE